VDVPALLEKLKQAEQSLTEAQADAELRKQAEQDSTDRLVIAEVKEIQLQEQLMRLREEQARLASERSQLALEKTTLADELTKSAELCSTLTEETQRLGEEVKNLEAENKNISEERKSVQGKLTTAQQKLQPANLKLETMKVDMDRQSAVVETLKEQLEAELVEKIRVDGEVEELKRRVLEQCDDAILTSIRSQYDERIILLEREVMDERTTGNQLHGTVEHLERNLEQERGARAEEVERERARVIQLESQVEELRRQIDQFQQQQPGSSSSSQIEGSAATQSLSERAVVGSSKEQRRGNAAHPVSTLVQPMRSGESGDNRSGGQPMRTDEEDQTRASQSDASVSIIQRVWAEPRTTAVQPLRGGLEMRAESKAMVASVRPTMAATQGAPTAAVAPTGMNTMASVEGTSSSSSQQQVPSRPTQQVQPVSSHVEESTVSSTEDPWWRLAGPSRVSPLQVCYTYTCTGPSRLSPLQVCYTYTCTGPSRVSPLQVCYTYTCTGPSRVSPLQVCYTYTCTLLTYARAHLIYLQNYFIN